MKKYVFVLFLAVWGGFSISITSAQNNVDTRITNNLNKLNFKYDVKDDGTFQFTMPVGNRTQMVFIHSKTSSYGQLEIREVYSVIYQSSKKPDEIKLNRLLIDNGQKKLGAWELIFEDNTYFIVFTAKIPAQLNDSDLKSTIDIVATSSDAMEQTLFNTDEW